MTVPFVLWLDLAATYQCWIEKNMEYIENNIFEIGK